MNLATALRQQDNNLLDAIMFGQLARALAPADDAATLLVADSFETGERRVEANELYALIPAANPLGWVARLRMAENLDLADDTASAIATLSTMADEQPDRIDALTTLARILRQRERYAEAAVAFDRAIQRLPHAEAWQWVLYYQRGICYERSQQWPKAEADFRRALELQPDQADVLNYLAYSWVDQHQEAHYAEAERMLARAVEQRPNSPQIIDSLAWVMYTTGRYPDAVRLLERAIELLPLDPVLLDHLGDAYWRVGRTLEARFQWRRALRNNPDNDLRPQLERKVERGLDPVARGN
jgi:tetratricopeptide (TPR) repeat protein